MDGSPLKSFSDAEYHLPDKARWPIQNPYFHKNVADNIAQKYGYPNQANLLLPWQSLWPLTLPQGRVGARFGQRKHDQHPAHRQN